MTNKATSQTLSHLAMSALAMPRPLKRGLVLALDIGLCLVSVWLAFYLRLGEFLPLSFPIMLAAFVSVVIAVPLFITSGLYRAIFRYNGLPAMVAVGRAMLLYGLAFAAIFTFYGVEGVPRTVGLIQPTVLLISVGASRAAARVWLGGLYYKQLRKISLPQALIYGAGGAGRQLASAMVNSPEIRVVGFLDDDERLHGQVLNGLPIYNPVDLAEILAEASVTDVLLAIPSSSPRRRNEILESLKTLKIAVRTLPGLSDIATGKISLSDVRELDIDDLLGRDTVLPNQALMANNIKNKVVLVSGAGGSIGSELCRQILSVSPTKLLLIEQSEFALYAIHQELEEKISGTKTLLVPILANVQDKARMLEIMSTWRPETVYHAAAYKHVPLVEHNPAEGIKNNVIGTLHTAQAAVECEVADFVLVSTDKAVRPTNIMGASKRLAEMTLQALAANGSNTKFSMVRFGNVLGSSGSVVPRFRQQIRDGGPITLTHPDITRFFMTIPEAAQLVIQAGAMAKGGDVFVLDMGESVKIIDLARRMVELSGLTILDEHNQIGDIEIEITGLRPGEKLYEELLIGDNPQATEHPRVMKAHESFIEWIELQRKLQDLLAALNANDMVLIRKMLVMLVSGYHPNSEIADWVFTEKEAKQVRVLIDEQI
jgi:FlaA1/EpsC-like NDP-sugar epimerase